MRSCQKASKKDITEEVIADDDKEDRCEGSTSTKSQVRTSTEIIVLYFYKIWFIMVQFDKFSNVFNAKNCAKFTRKNIVE